MMELPVDDPIGISERARLVLEQSNDPQAAAMLGRMRVEVDAQAERWTIGGRSVDAHNAVLLVPGDLILGVKGDAVLRERLRAALAAAFDTPTRVLRNMVVVLDDQQIGRKEGASPATPAHPYRSAPAHEVLPASTRLCQAAELYARAAGHLESAKILARARIEAVRTASGPAGWPVGHRLMVLLGLDDLARIGQDTGLKDRTACVIRAVAQSHRQTVIDVAFGADWSVIERARPADRPAQVLRDLLAAEGVSSVVVEVGRDNTRLVASLGAMIAVIDLGQGPSVEGEIGVLHLRVDTAAADLSETARGVRRKLGDVSQ